MNARNLNIASTSLCCLQKFYNPNAFHAIDSYATCASSFVLAFANRECQREVLERLNQCNTGQLKRSIRGKRGVAM